MAEQAVCRGKAYFIGELRCDRPMGEFWGRLPVLGSVECTKDVYDLAFYAIHEHVRQRRQYQFARARSFPDPPPIWHVFQ